MKRGTCALLLLVMAALETAAKDDPNVERGLKPGKSYEMRDVDTVNLFNGVVNLRIPLGGTYQVSSNLSYQFGLSYATNGWEVGEHVFTYYDQIPPYRHDEFYYWTYPKRGMNGGFGWLLSFGRLDLTGGVPSYVSPDGGTHSFYDTPHAGRAGETASSGIRYTRDGTYLRLRTLDPTYELDLPDGTVHHFDSTGRLKKMADRFGKEVTFAYEARTANDGRQGSSKWVVADSNGRTHTVYFRPSVAYVETNHTVVVPHEVVDYVDLAAFDGATARYQFHYEGGANATPSSTLVRRCPHSETSLASTTPVSLLTSVEMPLTSTTNLQYKFEYDRGTGQTCSEMDSSGSGTASGNLTALHLPAGAVVKYDYRLYTFPTEAGGEYYTPQWTQVPGIESRIVYTHDGGTELSRSEYVPEGVTTYPQRSLRRDVLRKDAADTVLTRVENYFSTELGTTGTGWEYGLPLSRVGMPVNGPFISTKTYVPGPNSTDLLKQQEYLTYAADQEECCATDYDLNRRIRLTKVVDEAGNYTQNVMSDYDGFGHYRTVTTTGTGSVANRVVTTNYNPTSATDRIATIAPSSPWLPGTYTFVETSDVATGVTTTKRTDYCFSATTGFLNRRRTFRGTQAGTNDLLAVLKDTEPNKTATDGNVSQEEYFGGDATPLPEGFASCTGDLSAFTPAYRVLHDYDDFGALISKEYDGTSFKTFDAEVDRNSGLPKVSRDTAGVTTTFGYDLAGDLERVSPSERAWTEYVYVSPGTTTGASLTIRTCTGTTSCDIPAFAEARFYFDRLGRVKEQRLRTGTDVVPEWATTWTRYDAFGRRAAVSVTIGQVGGSSSAIPAGTKETIWSYDSLGRIASVKRPDGSESTYSYAGTRKMTRSSKIDTGGDTEETVATEEHYDFLGRLTAVVEDAGGLDLQTSYTYDVGDRLTNVNGPRLPGVASRTPRSFTYDGAGLLISETHPESGTTTYAMFDARGNALQKRAAACRYDLNYTFDAAGRLVKVEGRRGAEGADWCAITQWSPLKEFQYGTDAPAGDLRRGKLKNAIRYNPTSRGRIRVTETYTYGDAAGRATKKDTLIERVDLASPYTLQRFSQSFGYDVQDRMVTSSYPICTFTGCGMGPFGGALMSYGNDRLSEVRAGYYYSGDITGATILAGPSLAKLGYDAKGLRTSTVYGNLTEEAVEPDPDGMSRPHSITVATTSACAPPVISTPPAAATVAYGQPVTLSVSASGTAPLSYQWYSAAAAGDGKIAGATNPSYTVSAVTDERSYWVEVLSTCGRTTSEAVKMTPVTLAPAGLTATGAGGSGVLVNWTEVEGATSYRLERRTGGSGFQQFQTVSTPSFTDETCAVGTACVYRVRGVTAGGKQSDPSNADLMTMMTFTTLNTSTKVAPGHFEEIRAAVNAIRLAAGSATLAWSDILAATIAAPVSGARVNAAVITSLRSRMNEALQAHAVPVTAYEDAVPGSIRRRHLEELAERSQ